MQSQAGAIVAGHLCLDVIPEMRNPAGDPVALRQPGALHQIGKAILASGGAVSGATGSGDSTIAGFLAAWLNGLSPEAALTVAVGVGAYCVECPDATSGVPTWPDLQRRLSQPWPRKPIRFAMNGWTEKSSLWFGSQDQKEMR